MRLLLLALLVVAVTASSFQERMLLVEGATLKCDLCVDGLKLFGALVESNASIGEIEKAAFRLCVDGKFELPEVCQGMIDAFGPEVVPILVEVYDSEEDITAVCDRIGWCRSQSSEFEIKPATIESFHAIDLPKSQTLQKSPGNDANGSGNSLTVLQLSDVHFDPYYVEGAYVQCGKPLCCRADDQPIDGNRTAGAWGDYECDINEKMIHAMLSHISATVKPDYIFWTGDNPPHNVWSQSREFQLNATLRVTNLLKTYFPNTVILPAIGNHESFPVDQFPRPPAENWLYSFMSEEWKDWLSASARETLNLGGYYSMLVGERLRVVALNTQYFDEANFFLLLGDTDPGNQLQWLNETLVQSQERNETIWLLGHIPTQDGAALPGYAQSLLDIIKPYSERVIALFNGHVHNDLVNVAVDEETGLPYLVQYICPSVTTFTNINPSFRLYEIDKDSYEVRDYTQYVTNVTEANESGHPTWQVEYSARAAYGLSDMSGRSWLEFGKALFKDDELFGTYYRHYYTSSPGADTPCDARCRKFASCAVVSATLNSLANCVNH
jgi:sphingomyelin phosphodiesterase